MNKRDRSALLVYFGFIFPGLVIYLFIVAFPILYSVLLSFSDFNPNKGGVWNFVGLMQYKTMIDDPSFWHALKNNMIVVAISVFGQIPIGFVLAFILYRQLVGARHRHHVAAPLPGGRSRLHAPAAALGRSDPPVHPYA